MLMSGIFYTPSVWEEVHWRHFLAAFDLLTIISACRWLKRRSNEEGQPGLDFPRMREQHEGVDTVLHSDGRIRYRRAGVRAGIRVRALVSGRRYSLYQIDVPAELLRI